MEMDVNGERERKRGREGERKRERERGNVCMKTRDGVGDWFLPWH